MKITNPPARNSVSHWFSPITYLPRRSPATVRRRRAWRAVVPQRRDAGGSLITVLLLLALTCFALWPAPEAFGVTPAPDGAYPGANTAEGQNALQSLGSGIHNTALGYQTLFSNTTGHDNMATGFQALFSNTTGIYNTADGSQALYHNTTGTYNTATGFRALYSNTTGSDNTSNGYEALAFNTTGQYNTAGGFQALYNNTTGIDNTANGYRALYSNTTGGANTATGYFALVSNTTGSDNTANGEYALSFNTTGSENTATGFRALFSNTTGSQNTANGYQALYGLTTGFYNTANGYQALYSNGTGSYNTANGYQALYSDTTGGSNIANGYQALYSNTAGSFNTANGIEALYNNTTGNQNIALGVGAGVDLTTGNFNIDIGNAGVAGESNTIRIGDPIGQTRAFIAGIYGVNEGGTPLAVYINSNGQLGTMSSSRRFKKEIEPMDQTSEAILALKPVTFHYRSDPAGAGPQFGLIAEEVAEVNPDLIVRDENGEIYTVRYEAVNAMLLNEFLKEHRKVQELESTAAKQEAIIVQQQKAMEAVTARLEEQDSKIQKVSALLELNKPALQIVVNE